MNNDTIRKKALLSMLDAWSGELYLHNGNPDNIIKLDMLRQFVNSVNDMPTNDTWTSCDTALPEDGQECIVHRRIGDYAKLQTMTGVWHADTKCFMGLRCGTKLSDAIEWMLVPEYEPQYKKVH